MREFVSQQRWPILGFALLWLAFAIMDLAQRYYFSGQFPTLQQFWVALYIFLPWWFFSVVAGWINHQHQEALRRLVIIQVAMAVIIGLLHVALLAARYWIFWPQAVEEVSIAFVFGEQFFKWFQFEILAYAACGLFWFVWLRVTGQEEPVGAIPTSIALQTDNGHVMVDLEDIEWLRADNNYVIVYAPPHEYRVRATLQSMVAKLKTRKFLLTHRSAVVNVDQAIRVDRARVELRSGARAPLSRRRRARLIAMLDARTI